MIAFLAATPGGEAGIALAALALIATLLTGMFALLNKQLDAREKDRDAMAEMARVTDRLVTSHEQLSNSTSTLVGLVQSMLPLLQMHLSRGPRE